MSQQGTVDASGLIEKQKAEQAAAALAKQKEQEEQQKKQIQADYEKYAAQQRALQEKIKSVPQESYQSGVEIRKDTIGKMVPISPGASRGRLVFEDQIFPVYSTRYTEDAKKQISQYQTELEQLEAQHRQRVESDSYYKSVTETGTTSVNVDAAQKRIQELQKKKAYIESFPTPTPQGKHVSGTQRAKIQELQNKRQHELNEIEREVKHLETFVSAPGSVIPGFQATAFEPTRYSSPSKSVGYNPATGQVEIGGTDGRNVIVSTSKTEDVERAKAAGYTGSATVDPRVSDIFRPVDSGIFTPGIKAQPSPDIISGLRGAEPQRTRAPTLQDQPDSIYANPLYTPKEREQPRADQSIQQRKKRAKVETGVLGGLFANPDFLSRPQREAIEKEQQYQQVKTQGLDLLSGIKTATPKVEPRAFTISLSEGAPQALPEYTQEQINQMNDIQYSKYIADVNAYNKYVEQFNAHQNILAREENLKIKQQNLLSYQQSKKEIISFIEDAKKQGYKTIIINTPTGPREVSVERAYKEIISSKDIIGIGVIPNIPEGYTVAGLSNMAFVPETTKQVITQDETGKISDVMLSRTAFDPKDRKPEFLEETTKKWAGLQTGNPIVDQAIKPFYTEVSGGIAGLVELEKMGGDLIKPTEPRQKLDLPQLTASSEYAGGVIGGAKKAIEKGNFRYFVGGTGEAYKRAEKLAKEQGLVATGFGLAGFLFPFGVGAVIKPVQALSKLKTLPVLVKGLARSEAKTAAVAVPKLAARDGTKILEPIKAYPQSKLRSQGYEPLPILTRSFTPKEEGAIRKAFEIPQTNIGEVSTKGPRLPERPRDIIAEIKQITSKPETVETTKPVFSETKIELGRGLVDYTRPQIYGPFPKGTKTFESKLDQPVKEVEGFTAPKPSKDIFFADTIKTEQVKLGRGTVKQPQREFTSEQVGLGKAKTTSRLLDLGSGTVKIVREPEIIKFTETKIQLDKASKTGTRVSLGSGIVEQPKPQIYGPFPKGTKTFESKLDQPVKEVEGFTAPKPSKDIFFADTIKTEQVKLGRGTGRGFETEFNISPKFERVELGKGEVSFIGKGGVKSTVPWKKFRGDDAIKSSKYVTILAKPSETKFVTTTVSLGTGKGTITKTALAGGSALAPAPLLGKAVADEIPEIPPILNTTQGNQTELPPVRDDEILIPEEAAQSLIEPQTITERRPSPGIAAAAALPTLALRIKQPQVTRLGVSTKPLEALGTQSKTLTQQTPRLGTPQAFKPLLGEKQKQPQAQKQRTKTPFPEPQRPTLRLAQPEAFKQKELLRLQPKFPKPRRLRLLGGWVDDDRKKFKKRKERELKPNAFIGNVRQEDILGMYKEFTVKVGVKRSARQARIDTALTRRSRPSLKITKSGGRKIISTKPQPFLKPAKSKRFF